MGEVASSASVAGGGRNGGGNVLKASLRWIGPFTVVGLVVLGFVLGAGAWSVIGDASTDPLVDSGGSPSSMTSTTTSGDDSTTTTIAAT